MSAVSERSVEHLKCMIPLVVVPGVEDNGSMGRTTRSRAAMTSDAMLAAVRGPLAMYVCQMCLIAWRGRSATHAAHEAACSMLAAMV